MTKARLAAVLVALCLLLTACGTPSTQTAVVPLPETTGFTIYIDQLSTYPPMPDGALSYVEPGNTGSRTHYTLTANIAEVTYTGKRHTLTAAPQSTAVLFADGTGLVLLSRYELSITSGWVVLDYSTPPGIAAGEPTAVLIHSIKEVTW